MILARKPVRTLDGRIATLVRAELPDGDAGTRATLGIMSNLARRDASDRRLRQIVSRHEGHTDRETAHALWRHMVGNYPYVADPETHEHVTAPVYTLTHTSPYPYRDCDDLATANAGLLTAADIPNRLKVISWRRTRPAGQYTHVYNEWYDKAAARWIPVDVVMGKDGWNNERKPIRRSETRDVLSINEQQHGTAMADSGANAIDFEAIGKNILTRILPKPLGRGENVGAVLQEHAVTICVGSVKAELYKNRYKLAVAGVGAGVFCATIGYVAALAVTRSKQRRVA